MEIQARDPVPLVRRFSPVPASQADSDEQQIQAHFGYGRFSTWEDIDRGYRSVILAEAGAGKTFEMQARAQYVEGKGDIAFFIRIEDIEDDFRHSFEVGNAESFEQWLCSQNEAWFYLDSVDEARLESPNTFRRAIHRFSAAIRNAQHRAHVCISSRPYAWRPNSDRELIERYLPFPKPQPQAAGEELQETGTSESQGSLDIFVLQPLDESEIRTFARHRSVPDVDRLIRDLRRLDFMSLAGRPFDLEAILYTWTSDQKLGSRSELLDHSVKMRLEESHDPDRADRQPLNFDKALAGARRLAAAVVLTGEAGIRVPDSSHRRTGIEAAAVLSEWEPADVRALLGRAIFDDVIYGAVRFRSRDVRECLAARWFSGLLRKGHSRHEIESLFFREQYGHQFVAPRLRMLLPWLILEDDGIRRCTIAEHPEIMMLGGDPALLPLEVRKRILSDVATRLVGHEDCDAANDNTGLARIAHPDLIPHTLALIGRYSNNDEALFFLARLVWQGAMSDCVSPLVHVAADPARGIYVRIAAAHAVTTCGTEFERRALWDTLLASDEVIHRELLADLLQGAEAADIARVLHSLERLSPDSGSSRTRLSSALRDLFDRLSLPSSGDVHDPFAVLIRGLRSFLQRQLELPRFGGHPETVQRRCSQWQRLIHRTRRSTGNRWSNWSVRVARPGSCPESLAARLRRSATGYVRRSVTRGVERTV